MRLELFSDAYWLLAEIRWIARQYLVGQGRLFVSMEQDLTLVSKIMSASVGTIEVTDSDLLRYARAFASLSFSFAHGAMIRFVDQDPMADTFSWASLVLEGIAQQLYEHSGLEDKYGYSTSKELTEEFRVDGYTEVDINQLFSS